MEIILIILTSAIISALLLCSFYFGYKLGKSQVKQEEDGLVLTEENKEFVKEMADWRNFFGGK